jgi:DNA-binding MarR family transcriptional regulator
MQEWSLLTNHARALLLIARDPDARLRDLAVELEVTERTAFGIVSDLTEAGYLIKEKNGRRNRYLIQTALPVAGAIATPTIGEVLELLGDSKRPRKPGRSSNG